MICVQPGCRADAEMKFRNYFPRDSDLQKAKHPPPIIPKFEDPVATDPLQVTGAEVFYENAHSLSALLLVVYFEGAGTLPILVANVNREK